MGFEIFEIASYPKSKTTVDGIFILRLFKFPFETTRWNDDGVVNILCIT
jgi:hypothetical protein